MNYKHYLGSTQGTLKKDVIFIKAALCMANVNIETPSLNLVYLFIWVLCHINLYSLFKAKSSDSNNSVR